MPVSKWPEVKEKMLLIEAWIRNGLMEKDVCHNLGISEQTFNVYKHSHPELRESLKRNKEVVDITVENALYKRAIGYTTKETIEERVPIYTDGAVTGHEFIVTKITTKDVPPDTTSMIFFLKNRLPDMYRDRREIEKIIEVRAPILEEICNTFANARRLHSVEVIDVEIVGR